jgi:predicted metalloendopeptidase
VEPVYILHEEAQERLRLIIEEASASTSAAPNTEARKVGDFYRSFMDEARIEALKMKPLAAEFEAIDRIKDKSEIPAALARLKQIGILTPVDLDIDQDKRNSTAYVAYLSQAGLGLPDREYYLDNDDARIVGIRKKYTELVESMMARMGSKTAKQDAADIVAFETALAKINWTKVENRDPVKTYHKIAIKDLPAYAPGFDWNAYLNATGVSAKVSDVVLYQDTYLKNVAELYAKTPLPVWKAYLKWRVLRDYGRFPRQGQSSTSASPSTERRSTASRRFARAGSAACRRSTTRSVRRWARSTSRSTSRPRARRGWKNWSPTCLPRTNRASMAWTGWDLRRRRRRTRSSPR